MKLLSVLSHSLSRPEKHFSSLLPSRAGSDCSSLCQTCLQPALKKSSLWQPGIYEPRAGWQRQKASHLQSAGSKNPVCCVFWELPKYRLWHYWLFVLCTCRLHSWGCGLHPIQTVEGDHWTAAGGEEKKWAASHHPVLPHFLCWNITEGSASLHGNLIKHRNLNVKSTFLSRDDVSI